MRRAVVGALRALLILQDLHLRLRQECDRTEQAVQRLVWVSRLLGGDGVRVLATDRLLPRVPQSHWQRLVGKASEARSEDV